MDVDRQTLRGYILATETLEILADLPASGRSRGKRIDSSLQGRLHGARHSSSRFEKKLLRLIYQLIVWPLLCLFLPVFIVPANVWNPSVHGLTRRLTMRCFFKSSAYVDA